MSLEWRLREAHLEVRIQAGEIEAEKSKVIGRTNTTNTEMREKYDLFRKHSKAIFHVRNVNEINKI